MTFPISNLRQKVTRWTTTPDAFGGVSFSAPQVLDGRWENRTEMFRDGGGNEIASEAIVYLGVDVEVGDWLFEGDSAATDPTTLGGGDEVSEVRQVQRIPDLRNVHTLRKVFL